VPEFISRPENLWLRSINPDQLAMTNPAELERINTLLVEACLKEKGAFHFSDEQVLAYTTQGGSPHLDMEYTVFGQTIEGLEVIDALAAVPTGRNDIPVSPVAIEMQIV
jgi:peptidyl-prolyl cis-trans isomerase B (cyclophilin B)